MLNSALTTMYILNAIFIQSLLQRDNVAVTCWIARASRIITQEILLAHRVQVVKPLHFIPRRIVVSPAVLLDVDDRLSPILQQPSYARELPYVAGEGVLRRVGLVFVDGAEHFVSFALHGLKHSQRQH